MTNMNITKTDSIPIVKAHTPDKPTPDDFDNFLPWAAAQFECEFNLIITRAVQAQYVSGIPTRKLKTRVKPKTQSEYHISSVITPDEQSSSITSQMKIIRDENTFHIETTYNDANHLVKLKFMKMKKKSRRLFQIINMAIPYHSALSSITINQGLDAEAIYEISKYYTTNRITELILDNCYVPEANYHFLLDNDVIKHFSLSRCDVTDSVVEIIASKLTIPSPAAKSLSALNLSINKITDIGVKYLAEMLRTNRQLSYLNLAHNTITDEGAKSILVILKKFALTKNECMDRSKRLISYMNRKSEMVTQTVQELRFSELERKSKRKLTRSTTRTKPEKATGHNLETEDAGYLDKAEAIVKGILGEFQDPFNKEEIIKGERAEYCLGNNTLRYLNLAYNNLTYISVRKIKEIIEYQQVRGRKPGLVNIRIDGNLLPKTCNEYDSIDNLLLNGLVRHKNSVEPISKKKTTTVFKH